MLDCIVKSNRPIDAEISAYLHSKASEMIRDNNDHLRLKGKVCRGLITAEGSGCIGSISGPMFKAEIEYELVDIEVTFIVRRANVESDSREWASGPTELFEELVALEERAQIYPRHLQ